MRTNVAWKMPYQVKEGKGEEDESCYGAADEEEAGRDRGQASMGNVDGDLGHAILLVFTHSEWSTLYLEESPQEPHGDDEVAQDGDAVRKVPVGHRCPIEVDAPPQNKAICVRKRRV